MSQSHRPTPARLSFSDYWKHIAGRIRHDHPLLLVSDGLRKLGISIRLLYVFQEDLHHIGITESDDIRDGSNIRFLGPGDMEDVSRVPFRKKPTYEQLCQKLETGSKCLGIRHLGELAAFTWCDLDEFRFGEFSFELSEDEAYLCDVYTFEKYRRKGFASRLRDQLHRELRLLGKKRLYSMSDCFNTPAIKLKTKLNARATKLCLHVVVLGRWRFGRMLRTYDPAE